MLWREPVTGFICGCISSDGHVNLPYAGAHIVIISTIEKTRAKEVIKVLRDAAIRTSLAKGGKSQYSGRQKWVVNLSSKNAQFETLLSSILHWKMEYWLGEYKLNRLKKLVEYRFKGKYGEGQIKLPEDAEPVQEILNPFGALEEAST